MLLNFKMKNFKSFYNTTELNMFADNNKREYQDRLINVKKGRLKKNVLPAMVIYGANASGKTTLITAIDTLREIVINGTIKKQINNEDINKLEIAAFIHDVNKMREPIEFEITFKNDLNIYNYILKLRVMNPLIGKDRSIIYEALNIITYSDFGTSVKENKLNLFERTEKKVVLNNSEEVLEIYGKNKNYLSELSNIEKSINENLDKETLFLTSSFKTIINLKIADDILNWFQKKLITVVNFDIKKINIKINNADDGNFLFRNKSLDKLVELADFGPQKIVYMKDENEGKFVLRSMYEPEGLKGKGGIIINSKDIESKGTTKLIDFWMKFIESFNKGGIFIIDELDSSIHPELIGGIIDLFNNRDINKNNAQLIFNTHNPLFLQKRFFRRDQILFIEKDKDSYISNVYKLSDFDVKNENNYMKKYFEGQFGALPFIDFESAIIKKEDK